jgi:hypothetical protein
MLLRLSSQPSKLPSELPAQKSFFPSILAIWRSRKLRPGIPSKECADDRYMYGGIQERGDTGFDILGDVFLKNIYAVYSARNVADCRSGMSEISALVLFSVHLGHSLRRDC